MSSSLGCGVCGALLKAPARFCTECGTPVAEPVAEQVDQPVAELVAASPALSALQGVAAAPRAPVVPIVVAAQAAPQDTSATATSAMVLGIVTWGLVLIFIGLFTGFVTAPIAVALGVRARARIDAGAAPKSGRGRATAGLWLGLSWLIVATAIVTALVFGQIAG
ncbi:MAG: hypothetical protein WDA27_11260 [Actinomycetota bacterium]